MENCQTIYVYQMYSVPSTHRVSREIITFNNSNTDKIHILGLNHSILDSFVCFGRKVGIPHFPHVQGWMEFRGSFIDYVRNKGGVGGKTLCSR